MIALRPIGPLPLLHVALPPGRCRSTRNRQRTMHPLRIWTGCGPSALGA